MLKRKIYNKHFLPLIGLAALTACTGNKQPADAKQAFDADFEPELEHYFVTRTDTQTGQKLLRKDLTPHGDTLGSLRILEADFNEYSNLYRGLRFMTADSLQGEMRCEYNEFKEPTFISLVLPKSRIICQLAWNDNGDLVQLIRTETSWDDNPDAARQDITVCEVSYSNQSAYCNWYAGLAEMIAGPAEEALHSGRMGRTTWHLPNQMHLVHSVATGQVISSQTEHTVKVEYSLNNNGQVMAEQYDLPSGPQHKEYTY